jgi:hypothetical protein
MDYENANTSEPSVEREVLLNYLLDQCDETARHRLRLGFPFPFLAFAALHADRSLLREYLEIHLPCYTPFDRLRTYQRLFREALTRLQNTPVGDIKYPLHPDHPLGTRPGTCKKFLVTAIRDGKTMLKSDDFRFLSVFLLISWLGLGFDKEALAEFENSCFKPDMDAPDRIMIGLSILRSARKSKVRKPLIDHSRSTEPASPTN